jgi:subtilisin family serine protease
LRNQAASALSADHAVVTVKFDRVLSQGDRSGLEKQGLLFYYIDGEVARTRTIYPVRVPWNRLAELEGIARVLRVESHWRPAMLPTLDVSGPEIGADSAWSHHDPLGYPLTGAGTTVADFDTGIDVFHPSFFFPDGDTLDWFDSNQDNQFTPGVDAIDVNENGQVETGEILRHTDGWIMDIAHVFGSGTRNNDDFIYQTYWDWLYLDTNNNLQRDFGASAGYSESDPCFGEPYFIALDDDQNGTLDLGEKIVGLGTSKIAGTANTGSIVRQRGVDLMQSDLDTHGHGTAVCGILAGNTARRHRFAGIAPDAEILLGNVFSDVPLSFLIPWARNMGADAMLYEFGSFIYEFLDGSSLTEELIAIEHQSIVQITPSGNLGRGAKHAVTTVAAGDSIVLAISVPSSNPAIVTLWGSTLWRTEIDDLEFRLSTPLGTEATVVDGNQYPDGYYVWSDRSTSPRGTQKFDMYVDEWSHSGVEGPWGLKVVNRSGDAVEVISNVADNVTSWAGGAEFTTYVSDDKNVTSPATSDRSLVNGSYSTRGFESYDGDTGGSVVPGGISEFSGRGRRIDGASLLDVCSPGNYDVYTSRSHSDPAAYQLGSYRQFSGTSAAGPHVAAAVALIRQAYPGMEPGQVEYLVQSGAAADAHTGTVYNDTWGYGKLRILDAIGVAVGVREITDGRRPPALLLDPNYPNPFNPTTWIPFYLPADGRATLKVFDVNGRLVKVVRDRWLRRGPHSVLWDGTDESGAQVSSGVYFCELVQGAERQTRKLTLVR